MRARSSTPKYECGICHRRRRAEQMIFSRHTKTRYCLAHMIRPERKR